MPNELLIQVKDLITQFKLDDGILTAVDHVSFDIYKGEALGLVGESGCGKSVTAFSLLNLIEPPGRVAGGEILYEGEDILKKSKREMRMFRGAKVSMVFQEPMTSLNPVFTIGNQIDEVIKIHQRVRAKEAKERSMELLKLVNIPLPEQRYAEYPHQLSGGMRQRVMIAMALACNPALLICDEPTTALDVTVQAQVLKLINKLKKQMNMSIMLITHDLAVISEIADRVIIMYAGQIVEEAKERDIFTIPLHPYTEALLRSIPSVNKNAADELYMIKGMVPNLLKKHSGCLFAPRCDYARKKCHEAEPELRLYGNSKVRCHKYRDGWEACE
ncbi:MAG: ABC transporter ATP-binding protein [Treponema sp.]|jgi:oligopeptide/dipeptide ABC transporter ATP-binding protein|nr:ABC transporter ATP-binding protein [Treponema sp.]